MLLSNANDKDINFNTTVCSTYAQREWNTCDPSIWICLQEVYFPFDTGDLKHLQFYVFFFIFRLHVSIQNSLFQNTLH